MRRSLMTLLVAAAGFALPVAAGAQQFPIPGKPVRIIVPFAAGGQTDIQARAIAQRMAETLSVPIIVENKPGASTLIGAREVQKAAPDGHTLLYTIATHVQMPHLYKTPPWDALTDFTPVTTGARSMTVLTAHISAPFNTVPELVAFAKANPGKLNYASFGAGSTSHLNGEMLRMMAEIDLVHVPYKGSGDAMKDHLSGVVQLFFDGPTTAIANAQTGRVKLIATAAETRTAALPQVPTLREQGYDIGMWGYLWFWGPARHAGRDRRRRVRASRQGDPASGREGAVRQGRRRSLRLAAGRNGARGEAPARALGRGDPRGRGQAGLEHDPEKWEPVFGKDHAQTKLTRRKRAHPVVHLRRHAVVAHHLARVAQAAGLALHDEVPQRAAGRGDEPVACLARLF
jgi:tripartite-type tricarboxylate transporter receptor subunit TctC